MRIDGYSGWTRAAASGPPASGQAPAETGSLRDNVDSARQAALSALRNERFGAALERLSDPRSSDALAFMARGEGASADSASVLSAYAENGH